MIIDQIYNWMAKRDVGGPEWRSPSWGGYRELPEEIRFLFSSDKLEFEIANGGLPQFLWNTFYHWRWILDDCEAGYKMIGANVQSVAIPEFRTLCDANETKCRIKIFECISTKDFGKFNEWMVGARTTLQSQSESLFYSDAGLQELKKEWYEANRMRIENLLC